MHPQLGQSIGHFFHFVQWCSTPAGPDKGKYTRQNHIQDFASWVSLWVGEFHNRGREKPHVRQWYMPMLAPQQGQLISSSPALGIFPTTWL